MAWDEKGTLKDYILDSYCKEKRLSLIFKRVQKRYPNYFRNEAEMLRWIEKNL